MDWKTFIVEILKAVVWPIITVIVILLIRNHLTRFGLFLRKVKYSDLEIEFNKEVMELSQIIDRTLPPTEKGTVEKTALSEHVIKLAQISPHAAVFEAWKELEGSILEAAQRNEMLIKTSGSKQAMLSQTVDTLEKEGKINKIMADSFRRLKKLRDNAAHSTFGVSADDALRFSDLAAEMSRFFAHL